MLTIRSADPENLTLEPVSTSRQYVPRLKAVSRQNFYCPATVSVSTPGVHSPAASVLASVSTNLPLSFYCLEAPTTEKPFFLPQRITLIK